MRIFNKWVMLAIVAALFVLFYAQRSLGQETTAVMCGQLSVVLDTHAKEFGEIPRVTYQTAQGVPMVLLVNEAQGTYTQVAFDLSRDLACYVNEGVNFYLVDPSRPFPGGAEM